ncbi:MAG: hypothetical protein ABI855_19670, partial [Bacteroidota bacterium]
RHAAQRQANSDAIWRLESRRLVVDIGSDKDYFIPLFCQSHCSTVHTLVGYKVGDDGNDNNF